MSGSGSCPNSFACSATVHKQKLHASVGMAPRRRNAAGQAAPEAPSLASLPDDLLLRCLELIGQEER